MSSFFSYVKMIFVAAMAYVAGKRAAEAAQVEADHAADVRVTAADAAAPATTDDLVERLRNGGGL